jgi:hypothetical protein
MNKKFFSGKIFISAVIYFLSVNYIDGQDNGDQKFIGNWITGYNTENSLKIGPSYYRIALVIAEEGGILITRMKSPDGNAFNVTADETEIDGKSIKISFNSIKAVYEGELNDTSNQIGGLFTLMGKNFSLSFKKIRVD